MRASRLPLAAALLAACSPPPPKVEPPKVEPPKVVKAKVETPARWAFRPPTGPTPQRKVSGVGTVYFGANGQRWLLGAGASVATPASTLATEPLIDVRQTAGGFRFLGEAGGVFEAPTALGPLAKLSVPSNARAFALGKESVLAIERGKKLVRSVDGGKTFGAPVAMSAWSGALIDVKLGADGRGLLLASPQQVFATSDDGATWSPAPLPSARGAAYLGSWGESTALLFDNRVYVFDGGAFQPRDPYAAPSDPPPPIDNQSTEWGNAVGYSRAALIGSKLLELVYVSRRDKEGYALVESQLGAPEAQKELKLFSCGEAWVAAQGARVVVACSTPEDLEPSKAGDGLTTRVYQSDDAGATWRVDSHVRSGGRSDTRLWLGPDGTIVFKNACLPEDEDGCSGNGIVKSPAGKWTAVDFGGGDSSLYELAFGSQGTVYGVGSALDPATGDRGPTLFVSTDRGRRFQLSALPTQEDTENYFATERRGTLAVADDGKLLGGAIAYRGLWHAFTLDEDGVAKAQNVPPSMMSMEFHERRGLALAGGTLLETFDLGAHWKRVEGPVEAEGLSLACSENGCLVGTEMARVGWDLTAPSIEPPPPPTTKPAPVYRTPLVCSLDAWASVASGARAEVQTLGADLEGALWAVATEDPATHATQVVRYALDAKGGLEAKTIALHPAIPPAKAAKGAPPPVSRVKTRIEHVEGGVVALRWNPEPPKPPSITIKKGDKKPAREPDPRFDVDVAWWSAATSKVGRAKLPKAVGNWGSFAALGLTEKGPVLAVDEGSTTKLWSLASGRPEELPMPAGLRAGSAMGARAAMVDGKLQLSQVAWPSELRWWWDARDPKGKGVTNSVWASGTLFGWPSSQVFGLERPQMWLSQGGALVTQNSAPAFDASALFVRLGASPTPTFGPAPIQLDVADKVCTKESKKGRRAWLPFHLGSRHPVMLRGPNGSEGRATATGAAAAWLDDAGSGCLTSRVVVDNQMGGGLTYLVIPANGSKGIAMRKAGSGAEVAGLTCTPTPGPFPNELDDEPGFRE